MLESKETNCGPKSFRNLDSWFTHPRFLSFVEEEWKKLGNEDLLGKMNKLKGPLRKWNKETFGNIDYNIQKFERELKLVAEKLDAGRYEDVIMARYQH